VRQVNIELLVLDPPAPLVSPLMFEVRLHDVDAPLPAVQTYTLGFNSPADVSVQAIRTWERGRPREAR
jgi:hypothetical protein